jgi:hypothetical protein
VVSGRAVAEPLKQLAQELFADIRGYFANAIISFITELSMFI